jgi:diguanylate cyclase (GGDEF)-like protein
MNNVPDINELDRLDRGLRPDSGDEVASMRAALALAEQRLDEISMIDPLTETLNRRGIESALWNELARDRRSGSNLSGILLWCDQLSGISTSLGHGVADVIVRAIANRIKACLRPSDAIAHIDVDKFLVLLPDTRIAEARRVSEKLRLAVRRLPLAMAPDPVTVDIRTSVVSPRKASCSIQEILEQAHFRPHSCA